MDRDACTGTFTWLSALVDENAGITATGDAVFGSDIHGLLSGYLITPPAHHSMNFIAAERNLRKLLEYELISLWCPTAVQSLKIQVINSHSTLIFSLFMINEINQLLLRICFIFASVPMDKCKPYSLTVDFQ